MKKNILVFVLFAFCDITFAQQQGKQKNDSFVFWQPGIKITADMFQGEYNEEIANKFKKDNRTAYCCTSRRSILDIPKKKKDYKTDEKAYFCPILDKSKSFFFNDIDTTEIKYAQFIFDLTELSARYARIFLANQQHEMDSISGNHSTGVVAIFYTTAKNVSEEHFYRTYYLFLNEVVLPRDSTKYTKCRNTLDSLLDETKEFATTNEDCQRFMTNAPLSKKLKTATYTIGDLRKNNAKEEDNTEE